MSKTLKQHLTTDLGILAILASTFLVVSCGPPGQGADPGVVDIPVAYTKRTSLYDDDGLPENINIGDPLTFSSGGDLYIRDRSSASASERNITFSVTQGRGDVKDVSANFEGTKLVFSLRQEDPNPNDNILPKWDIYEYDITSDILRRINTTFEAAKGNDVSPAYLPDGRIVFSSDRQVKSRQILLNEKPGGDNFSKPQFSAARDDGRGMKAMVLHVMNPDGKEIQQISFNQSHDLDPVVMPDGRILFARWNDVENNNLMSLYTIRPDGSDLQMYYGGHIDSHRDANGDTFQFTKPKIMPDGKILVLARPFRGSFGGGDLLLVDGENYVNKNQPGYASRNYVSGPGQQKVTAAQVNIGDQEFSTAGRYISAVPLPDGTPRLLISKGTCQLSIDDQNADPVVINPLPCAEPYLSDPAAFELPPQYGIWIVNMSDGTERPLISPQSGIIISDLQVIQPRDEPPIVSDTNNDVVLAAQKVGMVHIRSVYDMGIVDINGTPVFNCSFGGVDCTDTTIASIDQLASPAVSADDRPARFIRIIKPASIPDDNDTEATRPDLDRAAFGPGRNLGMREILGYSEIYPDGSAKFKVPANVAFGLEILDKNARRIGPRHKSWIQLNPGETLECNGCHQQHRNNEIPLPHGRNDAVSNSLNAGAPTDSYIYSGTENPQTNQPYLALNMGETIAETVTRQLADRLKPRVNVEFTDIWRPVLTKDPDISLRYEDLLTQKPVSDACLEVPVGDGWDNFCRVIINYKGTEISEFGNIQPIWDLPRIDDQGDLDPANDVVVTCTSCHAAAEMIRTGNLAGQLDLTGSPMDLSDDEPNNYVSYRELLFDDEVKALDDTLTSLVDLVVFETRDDVNGDTIVDGNGDPVQFPIFNDMVSNPPPGLQPTDTAAQEVSSVMSANGANASSRFFQKMSQNMGTVDHSGFLTDAEMRLISEWLDLGGQYFNNPYHPSVPMN
ncbi:MAG: hypothetical protein ACN4GM_09850 [Gammaproteobacteria bacterium]